MTWLMAYGDFKDLTRRTDGYQHGLASMVYKFFNKKSTSRARSETLAT